MSDIPSIEPPRLLIRFLRWFCHPDLIEDVEGDLLELFDHRVQKSIRNAKLLMYRDVLQLLRPDIVKNIGLFNSKNNTAMIYNYLKSAWRNLIKYKGFSAINIFSLSIGIAACLVIYLFVKDESSFDKIHQKNIYRLCEIQSFPGTKVQNVALSTSGMGPTMIDYFPEIRQYTRFWSMGSVLLEKGGRKITVENVASADTSFFEVFDYPLLHGDRESVLDKAGDIVVSEKVANLFFDRTNVVGEFFEVDGLKLIIRGVMKDVPENSHLQFSVLLSIPTRIESMTDFNTQFGNNFLITYFVLNDQADIGAMSEQFPAYLRKASGNEEYTDRMQIFLQPLEEVHLASMDIEHDYLNHRKFNGVYIKVFALVGLFILIIASVNFMNLTTARSGSRAKEIGVRKAIGAIKKQLFSQFIIESILLSFIALLVALLFTYLFIPLLNNAIDRQFSLLSVLFDWQVLTWVLVGTVTLGVIAGLYPSIHLSSFNTVKILKGVRAMDKKSMFRSTLVVFQFSLALGMIVCTIIVVQQLNFMRNTDIGFNQDHVLLVELNGSAQAKYDEIKDVLKRKSNVLGVTASGQRLGNNLHQYGFKKQGPEGVSSFSPSHIYVDYDFLSVYDIQLKDGRTFDKSHATDEGLSFIINESAAKDLGYENPIGAKVGHGWYPDDSLGSVIGVTKDFNFNSLHHKVNTLFISLHKDWGYSEMSVKLNGKDLKQGIKDVEEVYAQFVSDYPIKYQFMDKHMEELYKSDQQLSSVISIIAILSIFIGCMGLFGLASLAVQRRIKEVGIRKVMGASSLGMITLLSKDFMWMIFISFMIASPVTYLLMSGWLEGFAFRVDINPIVFILAGFVSLVIALLTIGYHVLKAVSANPIKALKYE